MAGVDLVQMSPTITKPVLKVVEHDLQLSLSDAQVILVVKQRFTIRVTGIFRFRFALHG